MEWISSWLSKPPKAIHAPVGVAQQPESTVEQLDAALRILDDNKDSWVKTSCAERAALIDEAILLLKPELRAYGEDGMRAKGAYGDGAGEEMASLAAVATHMAMLREAMKEGGQPKAVAVKQRKDGQHVVQVFPKACMKILFSGWSAEVWIQPGKEPSQGQLYRDKAAGIYKQGAVSLVLGAGNFPAVVITDVIHKLYTEDEVVILKMNPVNDFLGPRVEKIFARFVEKGWLRVVYGGAMVGKYLVDHPLVSSIHLTGSATNFNNIVWGCPVPPAEGEPILKKPITAELGNMSPMIVVPGNWNDAEVEYHANSVVAGVLANGGFNCCATRVLVTDQSWPLRDKFLTAIRKCFNSTPQRALWYPGSKAVHEEFKSKFPSAEELGQAVQGCSPALFQSGLSTEDAYVSHELWAPVLQEVVIPDCEGDVPKFLQAAVDFSNNTCWGSLSVSVLLHPSTKAAHPEACDEAVAALKFGTVMLNTPSFIGYIASTWGAYPGNDSRNIGSGNCYLRHTTGFYDHPEKTVFSAPFKMPVSLWDINAKNREVATPPTVDFMYSYTSTLASVTNLARVIIAQISG